MTIDEIFPCSFVIVIIAAHDNYYLYKIVAAFFVFLLYVDLSQNWSFLVASRLLILASALGPTDALQRIISLLKHRELK
jgi:hypothetical protein